ncbi:methyltransferase [Mycolicibacterium boenickei]
MNSANDLVRKKIMGYIVSQAVFTVCELGVPAALANGPLRLADLAGRVDADPDALRRFIRVLVAEGLFTLDATESVGLSSAGELLRPDIPGSLHHLATLMSNEAYVAWGHAGHSVRTGEPAFEQAYGTPYFPWLTDNPAASEVFSAGQAGLAELRLAPLLDREWEDGAVIADVGGGTGHLLASLLAARPAARGILIDLPHVVAESAPTLAAVTDRVEVLGGSFFDQPPPSADYYVLSQVLHDWDDTDAGRIIRNCRASIPDHGRLLILEQVLPDDPSSCPAALLDLHMLVLLGGRERSESQWRELLRDNGFRLRSTVVGPRSTLLEATPGASGGRRHASISVEAATTDSQPEQSLGGCWSAGAMPRVRYVD